MKSFHLPCLLTLICLAGPLAAATQVQCWTDEHGRRACGDVIPPQYAGKAREVFNEQGVVVEHKERARTAEEQAADEAARAQADRDAQKAQQQHAYDRYLIETYRDVHDLEETRDARLHALDARITVVQKAIADGDATLEGLNARKQALQKESKPVDKALERQIQDYRRTTAENPKALQQLQIERDKVNTQFGDDIARYLQLKQEPAAPQ